MKYKTDNSEYISAFALLTIGLGILFLWATHVLICIKSSAWTLLIIGIFIPPVGWVHGFGYWAGLL